MISWFLIIGAAYAFSLIFATIKARRQTHTTSDFMTAGSNIGSLLGGLTVAATLFSTFTLLGMPDLFRTHGIGAWIFLGVSDAAMAFIVIWFGVHLRRRTSNGGFKGLAGLLQTCYGTHWAGYLYLGGAFVFLVPYVAVQIRGVSIFMNAIFPDVIPIWGWATLLVSVMLIYSELGGLKAIIYADAIQGIILMSATLAVAYGCLSNFGGIVEMFDQITVTNSTLLSVPGPTGLLTSQFLLASFVVIVLIPVTQPQIVIRMVIMRDFTSLHRMAIFLSLFAVVLILATIPIGFYGAQHYGNASTADFLVNVFILDQPHIIAAAVAIGLIAAAISTADSQVFALGSELRSVMSGEEQDIMKWTRASIICFAVAAWFVALMSGDQLVLIARVGFAGTALMAPFILSGILSQRAPGHSILIATFIALAVFLGSVFSVFPQTFGPMRMDLFLLFTLAGVALISIYLGHRTARRLISMPN